MISLLGLAQSPLLCNDFFCNVMTAKLSICVLVQQSVHLSWYLKDSNNLSFSLKAGNVYLVDYAIINGIPENVIRGKKQHIAAPLCLLYEHPDNGLIPIAIQVMFSPSLFTRGNIWLMKRIILSSFPFSQLEQNPSKDTPIFRPNDPPLAWLLAKMWVRHAEFQVFQVLSHLLRTHLIVEVFCVATLRHLPAVHPINKVSEEVWMSFL